MKKLIFISLLVAIAYCKAADPDARWHQTVQHIPNWQQADALNLDNRHIGTIPADLNLPQLQRLSLGNNQIGVIPDNLNLPQLIWLDLNDNQIDTIPDDLNLPQLRMLDLTDNQIDAIGNLNLPQLQSLYLDNNHIEHINPGIFERFPLLEYINLNRNPLTQENVDLLRTAATATGRNIEIIADEIGDQYLPKGHYIKGD